MATKEENILAFATKSISNSKHLSVWNWLYSCPLFSDLFFTFSLVQNGDVIYTPNSLVYDEVLKEYIDKSTVRAYTFTLAVIVPYSTVSNSTDNITWANSVEGISDWIAEQLAIHNLPQFNENITVYDIEVLDGGEGASAVDDTGAKYQFTVQITYSKKGA